MVVLLMLLGAAPPTVTAKEPIVGNQNLELYRAMVVKHSAEVRGCYEAAKSTKAGKIKVEFVVDETGKVTGATAADDSLGEPKVTACLLEKVKHWTFPPPTTHGIVKVLYPFVFGASEGSAEPEVARDVIEQVVKPASPKLMKCFNSASQKHGPGLEGRLVLEFHIDATGAVVESKVLEDGPREPALTSCVIDVVRQLHFPAPAGGGPVRVVYPFVFKAS